MAVLSYRGIRRSVALLACLASAAGALTASPAPPTMTAKPFRAVQMNLCNSGLAGCYTGWSVNRAAAVIRREEPDLVTLNEVCQGDVETLGRTLRRVLRSDSVVQAFKAAPDRPTTSATRCRDGQQYGIGLLAHVPEPHRGATTHSGIYPVQDLRDPEVRVWLCVHAPGHVHACTTHLAYITPAIALAQCRYLLETAAPAIRSRYGYEPMVLGGDLNLSYGGSPDVRSCLPAGYRRHDDGALQHVMTTGDVRLDGRRSIAMGGTTDHPSLLVALTIRAVSGGRRKA